MTRTMQLVLACVALVSFSTVASAQVFQNISGAWHGNRGANVDIPPAGGPIICAASPATPPGTANAVAAPCVRHQGLGGTRNSGFSPANAGATGSLTNVAATGDPAAAVGNPFRVPANVINEGPVPPPRTAIPVVLNPVVQQLDTTFTFMAPGGFRDPKRVTGMTLNGGNFTPPTASVPAIGPGQAPAHAATRLFQTEAWSKPGQTSRATANILWTRGGPNGTTGAGFTRRIQYTKTGNGFGGTMHMVLGGTGIVWVVASIVPGAPPEALASPVGGGAGAGTQGQHPGRGYSTTAFRKAASGQVYGAFNIPNPCSPGALPPAPAGCGMLTGIAAPLFPIPGATTVNVGFPWTTGHISVEADYLQGANPRNTTLTAQGSDSIVSGVRTVQLVSGGVSFRQPPGGGNPTRSTHIDAFSLSMNTLPEPGPTAALAGVLGVIGILYSVRRRFA